MTREQLLVALVICSALFLPACGGGASTERTSSGTADTEDFIAQGEALCAKAAPSLAQLPVSVGAPEAAENAAAANEIRRQLLDDLGSLQAPEESRPDFERFLQVREATLEQDLKMQSALERGKEGDSLAAIGAKRRELSDKGDGLAREVGFSVCGNALGPEQEKDVTSVVKRYATSTSPKDCRKLYAPEWLDARFPEGDPLEACTLFQRTTQPADSVDIHQTGGPAPLAYAIVEVHGGTEDGARLRYGLRLVENSWKLTGQLALKEK